MRTATMFLVLLACIPSHVRATPCSGAEPQMASIWKELAAGNSSAAEQMLQEMERTHPECPEAILAHARIADAKGAAAEAEDAFVRYANLAPTEGNAYSYHASFLLEHGQYQWADDLSAQALEVDPNDAVALAVRGEILDMKGQPQQGMESLEKACQLDPRNARAQFQLATIYDRAKRLADAVSHFDSFLDYNYGRFLMKRNDLPASKRHLDRAVELAPDIRAPWYERAKLNLRVKNYAQAREDAERAANIRDPRGIIIDLQLYVLLEQIYTRLGDTASARKYAKLSRQTPVPPRKD